MDSIITTDKNPHAALYDYQIRDIDTLFTQLQQPECEGHCRVLYQLPTGGGKTVIFSQIVSRYLKSFKGKAIVLTHRKELSTQTASVLKAVGVKCRIINSGVKRIAEKDSYPCYVAMVETLNNRISDNLLNTQDIGLVIVDEAHHNSFRKLLDQFPSASVIGVTATPFSSDPDLPLNKDYHTLISGPTIDELIGKGFLAKPQTFDYEVELNTLSTGTGGDFSVSTSDELYSSTPMLDLLVKAYESHAKGKRTLIFNNGIFTSRRVSETFIRLGYPIRHLDNKTEASERKEILKWFKKTKGAILSSVSILTTGFDEPAIQTVILNRATTSLTLYHQMVGRGARAMKNKKRFNIIDLGNNVERFGHWEEPVDWDDVFHFPEKYHHQLSKSVQDLHHIPSELRASFPNSLEISFDVLQHYQQAMQQDEKAMSVMNHSIEQHAQMCMDNAGTVQSALELTMVLDKEIDWRIKEFCKCLGSVTKNYRQWLGEDYRKKLSKRIERRMYARPVMREAV